MAIKSLHENAFWEISSRIWTLVIVFFLTPFLITKLGSHNYGIYVIVMSVTGFMSVLNFGMGEATLRFLAYYHERNDILDLNRIITSSFVIYLLVGGIGCIILLIFANGIASLFKMSPTETALAKDMLKLMGIIFFFDCLSATFNAIPAALQRYDLKTKITIFQSIIQVTGTVILLLSGYGIYALVVLTLFVTLFIQLIYLFVARRLLPGIALRFNNLKMGMREVFNYSFYSMLSNIMGIIWANADRLLLGAFIGPNAVSFLSVPQQMVFRGNMLISGACAVLLPRFSTMQIDDKLKQLFLTSAFIMLNASIALFVPMTVLVKDFLGLWITADFAANSFFIAQLISASFIISGPYFPLQMLLGAINRPQWVTMIGLSNAIVSLSLNIILIPKIGLAGAGYSFLATCLTGLIFTILTWKYLLLNNNIKAMYRPLFIPMLLAVVSLFLCNTLHVYLNLSSGWLMLFGEAIIYLILSMLIVNIIEIFYWKSDSYLVPFFKIIQNYKHNLSFAKK